MNLRQLRYFCETLDAGSATAAAGRLHVAPTAISMQITQLEDLLGGELFDRSRRPMTLTALGRFLYPRAKELLSTLDRLEEDACDIAAGRSGWLAVGYTRSSIFSFLPQAVRTFREGHPQVQFELITMLSEHQPEQLLAGRIQVGIARSIGAVAPQTSLVYTKLFDDPFYLVVPIGHPFSRRKAIRAVELTDTPFVMYPKGIESRFADQVIMLLREAGARPVIAHEAREIHTALGLVASGLGCCLAGQSVSEGSRRDVVFVRVADLQPDASTVFAVTKAREVDRIAQLFLETLISCCAVLARSPGATHEAIEVPRQEPL
jgi:LysR family transcriptional regulator, benzoate and cis,cis-muconate-responsive activator of ben and cat genes